MSHKKGQENIVTGCLSRPITIDLYNLWSSKVLTKNLEYKSHLKPNHTYGNQVILSDLSEPFSQQKFR